mmetsp:Transcript_9087/g.14377  ORF Transcript_9087/g.14377 Transcript_9087/m.14377 type:complete len:673 (-) Transcript_9087:147-2165(-)
MSSRPTIPKSTRPGSTRTQPPIPGTRPGLPPVPGQRPPVPGDRPPVPGTRPARPPVPGERPPVPGTRPQPAVPTSSRPVSQPAPAVPGGSRPKSVPKIPASSRPVGANPDVPQRNGSLGQVPSVPAPVIPKRAAVPTPNVPALPRRATNDKTPPPPPPPPRTDDFGVNVAQGFRDLLGDTLVNSRGDSSPIDCLAGKVVAVYFSFSTCPDCQRLTKIMKQVYPQANFEIVLVGFDRDEPSFRAYFGTMPWLAVPYGSQAHEKAKHLAFEGISGGSAKFPRLFVFKPDFTRIKRDPESLEFSSTLVSSWTGATSSSVAPPPQSRLNGAPPPPPPPPPPQSSAIGPHGESPSIITNRAKELEMAADFPTVDRHAVQPTPSEHRQSVRALARYLLTPFEGGNDDVTQARKLRVLFRWIAENIAYDIQSLMRGVTNDICEPETVLRRGMSVCSGYSELLCALSREAGLDVISVSGYSKGAGYSPFKRFHVGGRTDHAWNVATIGGVPFLLDSTWAAGYCNGPEFTREWNPHYWMTSPEQFMIDHFPEKEKHQYLAPPVSVEEFDKLPKLYSSFWSYNNALVPEKPLKARTSGRVGERIVIEIDDNSPGKNSYMMASLRPERGGEAQQLTVDKDRFSGRNRVEIPLNSHGNFILMIMCGPAQYGSFQSAAELGFIAE